MEQGAKDPSAGNMWLDRRISDTLLGALDVNGPLHSLITRRNIEPSLLDVQLRRAPKNPSHCWASLYVGLTTVLDVHERAGAIWLDAHPTHKKNGRFDPSWSVPRPLDAMVRAWPQVEDYLNKAISRLDGHHTDFEGRMHAAMCSGYPSSYRVINREASPSFESEPVKKHLIERIGQPLWEAMSLASSREPWWPGVRYAKSPKRFGTSPDVLALDGEGRLLVIEAKPPGALEGITWGPVQVRFYADMFAELFRRQPSASDHIAIMLEQRIALGLTSPGRVDLAKPLRIVPVLAIGAGRASREAIKRATMVQDAINECAKPTAPVSRPEVWVLHTDGEPSLVLG